MYYTIIPPPTLSHHSTPGVGSGPGVEKIGYGRAFTSPNKNTTSAVPSLRATLFNKTIRHNNIYTIVFDDASAHDTHVGG